LKRPTKICGVVDIPLRDFIEVIYYIYPVIHGEIGLMNNALDCFYDVIDENIEVMSHAAKNACNAAILAHAALESAVESSKLGKLVATLTNETVQSNWRYFRR
jgi:hypothetical protein